MFILPMSIKFYTMSGVIQYHYKYNVYKSFIYLPRCSTSFTKGFVYFIYGPNFNAKFVITFIFV